MTSISQHQYILNDKSSSNISEYCCCCCCCYCSCVTSPKQQLNDKDQQNLVSPWLSDTMSKISSIHSCYNCIFSTKSENTEGNEIDTPLLSSSIECTVPVNSNMLGEKEDSIIDLEKLKNKKLHAITELLQTEHDYVQDLTYLVNVYLNPLSQQLWMTSEHKSIIIRNLHEILDFHKQFITLYNIVSISNHDCSSIAKAFLDQISQFSLYKYYCDMHAESWSLMSEYRDRQEWTSFIKECEILYSSSLSSPILPESQQEQQIQHHLKKLHFEDYLIKPVQRICRYQLLIKEIIRYTSLHTAEYDLWNSVLSEIQDLVTEIDDRKLQRDMKERTERFIERLDNDWRISKTHVSQLGNLLIAGAIEITYSALGQSISKPRYLGCFVFPTYIIMVRPKKVTSYEPKHWFPLLAVEFENLADNEGQREHSFIIRFKKHTFVFSASCSQEKQVWVKKLQEAIVMAKMKITDETKSAKAAHHFIVSSLSGISSKQPVSDACLTRSFTNFLDLSFAGNPDTATFPPSEENQFSFSRKILKRSVSTTVQVDSTLLKHSTLPNVISIVPPLTNKPSVESLEKKDSAADHFGYFNSTSKGLDNRPRLKPRNNSEMYIKPDLMGSGLNRRRPSSLDLFASSTHNTGSSMIGKMSLQLKNNHQHALRVTVDHKLRDVCTQEYLSSRAWYIRDRDQQNSPSFHVSNSVQNSNTTILNGGSPSHHDLLKKQKSTPFIKTSASSFSIMIPKRANEIKQSSSRTDYERQSLDSSCSISIDPSISPTTITTGRFYRNTRSSLKSSQLFIYRLSQNQQESISEVSHSSSSEYSFTASLSSKESSHKKTTAGKKEIFVGKMLRRFSSFHQKSRTSYIHFVQ
ncbi:uncharacterized protein BX663DRAFT_491691 [Cokeromyces recurvatus]|uniref:uncharacterized protein n=1 Tax=Cokeromyces recurvatus TaxID=90255 RepID=UPI00222073CB|nr:uncharacterized protein BX663DRAFT_491691 [Cokeromyces recurvatus]KAI7907679.1 hypothetical protein BX663DRAFT_491691 [Cokeromyces recurvatus]